MLHYFLVRDKNDGDVWYGCYDFANDKRTWSSWRESICTAIANVDYSSLDGRYGASTAEEFLVENSPNLETLYSSTNPLTKEEYPELFI